MRFYLVLRRSGGRMDRADCPGTRRAVEDLQVSPVSPHGGRRGGKDDRDSVRFSADSVLSVGSLCSLAGASHGQLFVANHAGGWKQVELGV